MTDERDRSFLAKTETTYSSEPPDTLTADKLLRMAKKVPRSPSIIWFHSEEDRERVIEGLERKTTKFIHLGIELRVDPEENPDPGRMLVDYRTRAERRRDEDRGLRAFEIFDGRAGEGEPGPTGLPRNGLITQPTSDASNAPHPSVDPEES